jgi:diguanylate cyclase (GGDEF)-like protein
VVVLRDVTAQHRLASQLSYEASHDALTSVYNRRKFEKVLEDAINAAHRHEGTHALAFLDLDRFKFINDSCGHAIGDRVLFDLANLLQTQLRVRDVLARIGGDEFAVLLHDCTLDNARRVLEKVRAAVDGYRIAFNGREYGVGVSIGVTVIDGSETDSGAILARADAACYAAKSRGRNAVAG